MIETFLAVAVGLAAVCRVKGWRPIQFSRYSTPRRRPATAYYPGKMLFHEPQPASYLQEIAKQDMARRYIEQRMLLREYTIRADADAVFGAMVNGVPNTAGPHHHSCASRWGANKCDCGGPA